MSPADRHEQYEVLLVKAVDGQLTSDEQRLLDAHLAQCAQCREELADFTTIKETSDAMTQRILQDARLEPPREIGARRAFLNACFALVVAGLLILTGFGTFMLLSDPMVPLLVRVGAGAAGLGTLGLLLYLLVTRLRGRGADPYQEIDQ